MTTRALPAVTVLLVVVGSVSHAAAPASQRPSVLQTPDLGSYMKSIDMAVSPTGNQLVSLTPSGAFFHALNLDGTVPNRQAVDVVFDDKSKKCAFTPNGRYLILARANGYVYCYERATEKLVYVDAGTTSVPFGLCVIEDPPLALVGYKDNPLRVAVINHSGTPKFVESVSMSIPGVHRGLWLCASADGRFAYLGVKQTDLTVPLHALFAQPCQDRIGVSPWRHNFTTEPTGCCIGPDPFHVLVPTLKHAPSSAKLRIVSLAGVAESTEGCYLSQISPGPVSFTNDGYYAVIPGLGSNKVTVISGHDLRARLDPNAGVSTSIVRQHTLTLDIFPQGVALHPTKPIGYAWSSTSTRIAVIKLAVPGVE
ncbi:MAG: hypothetical protein KKI08_17650, partial [Armatimonadetes bacterium]|nr:hypothetical protein [Armatimonadota bacterium]